MNIESTANLVRVNHKLTHNLPNKTDMFIEVDDINHNPIAVFNSSTNAAKWLEDSGYQYVMGSQGIWARKDGGKKSEARFSEFTLACERAGRNITIFALALLAFWFFAYVVF